jgi:phosphopantothenoylcysteine decarboxylase/phosphopantothenate--cysteine ligase
VPVPLPGSAEWLGPALLTALCGQPVCPGRSLPPVTATVLAPCSERLRAMVEGGVPVPGLGPLSPPVVTVPAEAEPGGLSLAQPEAVCETVAAAVTRPTLAGIAVLVTAGPTCEDIDPVRFLSNRSSGLMGLALALAAWRRGAAVTLVHGPLRVPVPELRGLAVVPVRSAREMHGAVMDRIGGQQVAILCAAVADFAPAECALRKIRKESRQRLALELVPTPDILAAVGALSARPFLVGFAAETHELRAHAADKLRRKNCDLLCANDITEPGSGFAVDTNRITLFSRDGSVTPLPCLPKTEAADRILDRVAADFAHHGQPGR